MDKIIYKLKKGYEENIRSIIVAFLISVFGSYVFWGNALINPDTLIRGLPHNLQTWDIQIGRYGLYLFYFLNHGFSSSFFSSFIAIFFFLLAGLFIIKLFNIEDEWVKIIVMALISCSTYAVAAITYPFCADANAAGVFFAIFAIWILNYLKYNKFGIAIGAVCLAFSISIYQSNIGITAITGVVVLVGEIFKDKRYFKKILGFTVLMLLGSIFYYIGLKISLLVFRLELADYRGANQFGLINIIKNLPTSIPKCYWDFFSFYFVRSYRMSNPFGISVIYALIGLVSIVYIVKVIIVRKTEKIQWIMIGILFILSPIACNLINIVIPDTTIGILLTCPMIMFPSILFALCYTLVSHEDFFLKIVLKRILCVLMCCLTLNYIFINNVDGLEYKRHEDQLLYLVNRVYGKLEDRGAVGDASVKVGIFGNPTEGNYRWQDAMLPYLNDYATIGFFWGGYDFSFLGWKGLFSMYLGDTSIQWCNSEEEETVLKSEEFKAAPIYPAEGSILKIGNVVVVKFANYKEN